jgi:hypothetical protein
VFLVSVVFYQVEVSVMSRSLIHWIPTECVCYECDLEASTMKRPWLTEAVKPQKFHSAIG